MLLVTGPVTKNMREALERTYDATPDPKWVVAVGDCAADGGIFAGSYAGVGGVSEVVPVDLHIRGCPPSPIEILRGLLALLDTCERKNDPPQGTCLVEATIIPSRRCRRAPSACCSGDRYHCSSTITSNS